MVKMLKIILYKLICLFFHLSVNVYLLVYPSLSILRYLHLMFLLDVTHNTTEGQSIIKETSKLVPELSTLMNGK